MSKRLKNFVKEISTSTGTGNFSIAGETGFRRFSDAYSTGGTDEFFYAIRHKSENQFEFGTGHLSDSSTLVRDTVIDSSNADSLVDFLAGDKEVLIDRPGEHSGVGDPLERKVISSAQATVDLNIPNDNGKYKIMFRDLASDTDDVQLQMRVDSNGDGTFEAGTSDYSWVFQAYSEQDIDVADESTDDSKIALTKTSGSNITLGAEAGESANYDIYTSIPDSNYFPKFTIMGSLEATTRELTRFVGSGRFKTAGSFEAVRFLLSSGNINNGTFEVYRIG